MFKIRLLPIPSPFILHWQETATYALSSLHGVPWPVRHVRHQGKPPHILDHPFVHPRTAAWGVRPQHLLEVVDVDVVADDEEALDDGGRACGEEGARDMHAEVFRIGVQGGQEGGVDLQGRPDAVGLEGEKDVFDGKGMHAAVVQHFCCGEGADESVLREKKGGK